ncbi:MAG: hypothetical protein ACFFDY_06805 [Candidatus Thorarchaeota archaeon]
MSRKINCRKCGKPIKLDPSTSSALCRKCRKTLIVNEKKTTENFDF